MNEQTNGTLLRRTFVKVDLWICPICNDFDGSWAEFLSHDENDEGYSISYDLVFSDGTSVEILHITGQTLSLNENETNANTAANIYDVEVKRITQDITLAWKGCMV